MNAQAVDAPRYVIEAPGEGDDEVAGYSPVIIAEATTSLKRLSVSEAVMGLDLSGAACIVFQHGSSGRVNIIYRRLARSSGGGWPSRGWNRRLWRHLTFLPPGSFLRSADPIGTAGVHPP